MSLGLVLLSTLLAGCASPSEQASPATTPGAPCNVIDFDSSTALDESQLMSDVELGQHHEAMRGQLRRGELDQAIQHFQNIESRIAVPRGHAAFEHRLALESMYTRAVMAREFLLMRNDRPGHPAAPPVLKDWPASPW